MKKHEEAVAKEDPRAQNTHCMANGCPNRNQGGGLCDWHDALESTQGFPQMTEFLQTHEFKQMSWLWQRLMRFYDYKQMDEVRTGLTVQVLEHARLLYRKMRDYGFPVDELKQIKGAGHNEDVSPRAYGIRMRSLAMRIIAKRIDDEIKQKGFAI